MTTVMDEFIEGLRILPGVQEAEGDMFGERSFQVGGREFLHVHGRHTLHILLPRERKAEALARGVAHQHPYAPRSGMVEVRLTRVSQLEDVLGLARSGYELLAKNSSLAAARS